MPRKGDNYWEYFQTLPPSLRSDILPLTLIRCSRVFDRDGIYQRPGYPFTVWEKVTAGRGFVTVDGVSFSARQGDLYVLPRGADSTIEPDRQDPWHKRFFLLAGPLPTLLWEQFGFKGVCHFPGGAVHACGIFDILERLWEERSPEMHVTAAEQLLKLLWRLRCAAAGTGDVSSPVQRARQEIDRVFSAPLDLDRIAASVQLSRSRFQTLFKRETGVSPYEYHLRRKFEKAKELLLQSKMPIGEIARFLAFRDRFHFSREFRKRTGLPPAAFRRSGGAADRAGK